jgi:hypothetical protein
LGDVACLYPYGVRVIGIEVEFGTKCLCDTDLHIKEDCGAFSLDAYHDDVFIREPKRTRL